MIGGADGEVLRLRLTGQDGLTANAWLLRSRGELALIDTGYADSVDALHRELDRLGHRLSDIGSVFYTHTHPDHMGGGIELQASWRPTSHVRSGSVPARTWNAWYDGLQRWDDWIGSVIPDGPLRDIVLAESAKRPPPYRHGSDGGSLPNLRELSPGASVNVGDLRLICVDGRGHDPFHGAWIEPSRGWLFSGDVVLGVPTPLLLPMRDDLRDYAATLDRWQRSLEVRTLFAGHGPPTHDFGRSVFDSREHLRILADAVSVALASVHPVDPSEVATTLMRHYGSRNPARFVTSIGSVESQLSLLAQQGRARLRPDRKWERA